MEKLIEKLASCQAALATLDEAVQMPFSVIVRDACIQRFEYSFESTWKLLKKYLEREEGVVCNTPKSCFREAFQSKLLSDAEMKTCMLMTDDRNLTSHDYLEAVAELIYSRLKNYLTVMRALANRIQMRIEPKAEQ